MLWVMVGLMAAVYCLARGIQDFRQKNYVWAVAGLLSAAAILFVPVQTHAVKVVLPETS
jgi:hypothetical protein